MGSTSAILKLFLVLSFFIVSLGEMHANAGEIDSISVYFDRIRALVAKSNDYPVEFLNIPYLKTSAKKAIGIDKVKKLHQLYTAHAFSSWEAASDYNSRALRLSSEIGYREGELKARYNTAYLLFIKGDFDGSFHQILEFEQEVEHSAYSELRADIATLKSDIFTERGHTIRRLK